MLSLERWLSFPHSCYFHWTGPCLKSKAAFNMAGRWRRTLLSSSHPVLRFTCCFLDLITSTGCGLRVYDVFLSVVTVAKALQRWTCGRIRLWKVCNSTVSYFKEIYIFFKFYVGLRVYTRTWLEPVLSSTPVACILCATIFHYLPQALAFRYILTCKHKISNLTNTKHPVSARPLSLGWSCPDLCPS